MPPAVPPHRDERQPLAEPLPGDRRLAERVREAVLHAVAEGFEEASMSGLCAEGAIESALGRARNLDLAPLLADDAIRQPNTNP